MPERRQGYVLMGEKSCQKPVGQGQFGFWFIDENRCFRIKAVNNPRVYKTHFYVSLRAWARPALKFSGLLPLIISFWFIFLSVEIYVLKRSVWRTLTTSQHLHRFALYLDLLQVLTSNVISKAKTC